jgi:hypothetical protein
MSCIVLARLHSLYDKVQYCLFSTTIGPTFLDDRLHPLHHRCVEVARLSDFVAHTTRYSPFFGGAYMKELVPNDVVLSSRGVSQE